MGSYINKGNDAFRKYANSDYIDKTLMIDFISSTLDTDDMLTCVTRPRRFGKSMAAKMLCAYYDCSCHSAGIFGKYAISGCGSFASHLNKYHVIYLDITTEIGYVSDINDVVKSMQRSIIGELRECYSCVRPESNHLMRALKDIHDCTGHKFLMIIDEWDAILREAVGNDAIQLEYIQFLRTLFKGSDTESVFVGAYMTGILPIKKYGTQSALSDFREYSMAQPGQLAESFGFTFAETKAICDKYGMDFDEMRQWYNGYEMQYSKTVCENGNISRRWTKTAILNPNSVMMACKMGNCANYWSKTESFESLRQYLDMDFDGIQDDLRRMMGGGRCHANIMTFGNDASQINSKNDLFALLAHLGYFSYSPIDKEVYIPNQEIREEFVQALEDSRHKELAALIKMSRQILESTWQKDGCLVAKAIDDIHNHTVAPDFYNNEQALRSVVKMAYLSALDYYVEIQELPSGKGYADIVFVPRRNSGRPAMIVELKWNETARTAISQIRDRDYPSIVKSLSDNLLLVGINYNASSKTHQCTIESFY